MTTAQSDRRVAQYAYLRHSDLLDKVAPAETAQMFSIQAPAGSQVTCDGPYEVCLDPAHLSTFVTVRHNDESTQVSRSL